MIYCTSCCECAPEIWQNMPKIWANVLPRLSQVLYLYIFTRKPGYDLSRTSLYAPPTFHKTFTFTKPSLSQNIHTFTKLSLSPGTACPGLLSTRPRTWSDSPTSFCRGTRLLRTCPILRTWGKQKWVNGPLGSLSSYENYYYLSAIPGFEGKQQKS